MKRESEGLGGGLQNHITQFNSAALLQIDGGRGLAVWTRGCEP